MMRKITYYLNYRPLSILSISAGVRDILLGIGFLIGWDQITRTLIFQNYNELIPGFSGHFAGALFILVGLGVIVSACFYKRRPMSICLKVQAYAWLFSTLMYLLNGHFLLAIIFGIFFCFPAGYTSYYVKTHPALDEQMKNLMRRDDDAETV